MSKINRYHTLFPSLTKVDPLRMTLADIHIEDIAHHLARICRFGGGCAGFISVASHSVRVFSVYSEAIPFASKRDGLTALLHDASEAYLGDLIRGMKSSAVFAEYRKCEKQLNKLIAKRFDLFYPLPPMIKRIDQEVGDDEAESQRFNPTVTESAEYAKAKFLQCFYAITEARA